MRIAFSGYLPAPCYKLVDERLQIRSEERRQYRHSFVDVLWHIVELHMIRAFHDVELLVGACGALIQIVAHPFASRHTPSHDLQRLRKEYLRHVVCVIRDDLIEASSSRSLLWNPESLKS